MTANMDSAFIGHGWRFPIIPDETGGLGYTSGDENVEQSLRILLLTEIGQRVMRSDFGTRAPRLVFSPGSVQYLRLLESTVRDAVIEWEPRVELQDVRAEADPDPDQEERVIVSISYRVRATNTSNNIVFPFYLNKVEQI